MVNADRTLLDDGVYQFNLFTDYDALEREKALTDVAIAGSVSYNVSRSSKYSRLHADAIFFSTPRSLPGRAAPASEIR